MVKNIGPRTEPWRTPQEEAYEDGTHLTWKERDDK